MLSERSLRAEGEAAGWVPRRRQVRARAGPAGPHDAGGAGVEGNSKGVWRRPRR